MQGFDQCVLCRGRTDTSPCVISYYKGQNAHKKCVEEKVCVYCGLGGLCLKCSLKDCLRFFHYFCFFRYFSNSSDEFPILCDHHIKKKGKKKEYSRLWLTRNVANKACTSPETLKKIKETQSDNKNFSICSGQVFWYIINTQYFPNFINYQYPDLYVNYFSEPFEPWNCDINDYIQSLHTSLEEIRENNSKLMQSNASNHELPITTLKNFREEEIILSETRNLLLKEGFEEYLKYFENKVKEDPDFYGNAEKRISSLREVPKNEEDFVCSICGDGDYDDDDLIVICSACEMGAHMKCYGIPIVPEVDWYCHACTYTSSKAERNSLKCALCPIKGGCLKPTVHRTTGSLSFPNYSEGLNELVWCHIFCAIHLGFDVFGNKENFTEINLKKIDAKRFSLKCHVCKTKDGACLQCQHGRCQIAFHPECGKEFFTNTRDKTGYDEVSIYCSAHKPLKLRRVLEGKEKKCLEDIVSFCKAFEKIERKNKKDTPQVVKKNPAEEKVFSCKEKEKLIKVIEKEIGKLRKNSSFEFNWIVKKKNASLRNSVEASLPNLYNHLDPLYLYKNKITIPGRKFIECFNFYTNYLSDVMKQELLVMNLNVITFTPKVKKHLMNKIGLTKEIGKKKIKIRKDKKIKKKETETADENYFLASNDTPMLSDLVSSEVYCICRKPFVEKSFKKSWESETDFEIRQHESKMIQCDKCEEWYHYKCIGLKFDEPIPDDYTCDNCKCLKVENNNLE